MWVSFKDILNYAVPATPVAPRVPMTMTTTTIGLETNDDNVDVEEEDKENVCGDIKEGTKDTPRKGWRVINEEKVSGAEPVKRILLQAEKVALPEIHDTRHLSLSLSLSQSLTHTSSAFSTSMQLMTKAEHEAAVKLALEKRDAQWKENLEWAVKWAEKTMVKYELGNKMYILTLPIEMVCVLVTGKSYAHGSTAR
jgi:hypothetical protein